MQQNDSVLYDENLEKQLLGCILIENRVLQNIELELSEDSFYFAIHKTIFKTIKSLLQTDRQADEQTIYYSLIDDKNIPLQGEELKAYISSLSSSGIGAISTPREMVKILNFLALKRQLNIFNKEINSVIESSGFDNIDAEISKLEQQIYSITNDRRSQDTYTQLGKYTATLAEKLQKARKSEKSILGIRTGLTDMDNYTGGLQRGDLIIIAARPSMGKTALATTIAKGIAEIFLKEKNAKKTKNQLNNDTSNETDEKPQSVAMFSLEMSGEQLAARIVSMDTKFSTKTIHTGRFDEKDENGNIVENNKKISDAEWNKIYKSMQDVGRLPLYIDDTPALNISVLHSRARYMKNRYNVCAIIIDYLQLLRPSKSLGGNRVLEIAEITGTLKAIAKELDIPVIALSQLSRAVESSERKDKKPQLSDLRESGTIEQDADIVMLLYREEYYLARAKPSVTDETNEDQINAYNRWLQKYQAIENLAEVIVAKNRNGAVGTITLSFDREHMLFSGYDKKGNPYANSANNILPNTNQQQLQHSYLENNNGIINDNVRQISTFNEPVEKTDEIPDDLKDIFT